MSARKAFHILVVLLFLTSLYSIEALSYSSPPPDLAQALRQETGGMVRISYHSETGKVRFIGTDLTHPIAQPEHLAQETTPEVAARSFLTTYGSLFGLTDPAQELTVMRTRTIDAGRSMVRFQQVYQGIQVLGGELIVNMDAARNVLAANGEVLPDIKVDIIPALDAETAQQIALQKVAKDKNLGVEALIATQPELWIYNPMLLGGSGLKITSLVWRMEVQAKELLPIRELVLVDAHLGIVVLHFNQIDTVLNRTIYDNQNTQSEDLDLFTEVCTEGNCPGSSNDYNFAYDFAGDTYNFYSTNHGRDSLNGAGMPLISTVRYCPLGGPCPYPNAFWNGSQMVYGEGYSRADDVVGHEMTHGVTDHESRLFYYMQSGAINESFSDIWGEFIDQANSFNGPGGSILWRMGEDLGAIRSMEDPTIFGDPDRMGSPSYYCSVDDLGNDDMGGVHTNSGVGNKSAYLMANGGTFNFYNVTALGIPKTAKIFYEVQTNLLTSGSDYQDLYDSLQQACTTLTGTAGITAADCQEVKDAVDATQMNQQPAACAASQAPVCPAGQSINDIFFDNLENTGSGNWSSGAVSGNPSDPNEWYYPQNSHPYNFDATYATSGIYNFWGYDLEATGDYAMSMLHNVTLPPGSTPYLHFKHAYGFENGNYDGGVLEYSVNGGAWTDAGPLITENGYDGSIYPSSGNPLGGKQGFVNNSDGYISSRLNLSSLAGHNVKFRFRLGSDVFAGDWGWFIDDIRIYTCGSAVITNPVFMPFVSKPSPPPPGTFYSVADTYIMQGRPTNIYGDANGMYAGYDDSLDPDGQIVRGLVKFDVSAIPYGTSINSATLNVYYAAHWDYTGYSRTITAYHPASDWSEFGVYWNNAPSPAGSYGSVAVVADGTWRYVSIDVTNLVRGWVNGSIANYGIMLRGPEYSGSDSSWRGFGTREMGSSYIPTLAVTYPTGVAASEPPPSGENLPGGQTILQALTGQAYNPLDSGSCQPVSDPQAPRKCLSTR